MTRIVVRKLDSIYQAEGRMQNGTFHVRWWHRISEDIQGIGGFFIGLLDCDTVVLPMRIGSLYFNP